MNWGEYIRSVINMGNLTFAIIALTMAILIHSQVQMDRNRNKGKSKGNS